MLSLLSRKQAALAVALLVLAVAVGVTAVATGASWAVAVVIILQAGVLVGLLVVRQQIGLLRREGIVQPLVDALGVERLEIAERHRAIAETMAGVDGTVTRLEDEATTFQQDVRQSFLQVATDTWAFHNLAALVDVKGEFPPAGGWAATPQTVLAMVSEVQSRTGDVLAVECGSGTSTVWLAAAMRQRGAGRVVAVEHEEEFADATRAHLRRNHLEEWAEVRCAPLAPVVLGDTTFDWYDLSCFEDLDPIDMLLVDGPPFRTGDLARYPAAPALVPRLAADAFVVLDDVGRDQERQVAYRWVREEFGGRRLMRTRRLDRSQVFAVVERP